MRKTKPKASVPAKASKVQLRLRADQKAVLERAALLRHTSLSQFMVQDTDANRDNFLADAKR